MKVIFYYVVTPLSKENKEYESRNFYSDIGKTLSDMERNNTFLNTYNSLFYTQGSNSKERERKLNSKESSLIIQSIKDIIKSDNSTKNSSNMKKYFKLLENEVSKSSCSEIITSNEKNFDLFFQFIEQILFKTKTFVGSH